MRADSSEALQRRGLQVTAQRLAAMQAVAAHPHGVADVVADLERREIGAISRPPSV